MPQDRPPPPMQSTLCLTVQSDPLAVRAALSQLMDGLTRRGVPGQALGSIELVLAEVLNNVVEHAYARGTGPIEITLTPAGGQLDCLVCDQGRGMPRNALPEAAEIAVDGPIQSLPEGGFGWTLIHKLADDIAYSRAGQTNRLRFRIPITPTGS
jgi:serine/threonine-protein kinase RsbW